MKMKKSQNTGECDDSSLILSFPISFSKINFYLLINYSAFFIVPILFNGQNLITTVPSIFSTGMHPNILQSPEPGLLIHILQAQQNQ